MKKNNLFKDKDILKVKDWDLSLHDTCQKCGTEMDRAYSPQTCNECTDKRKLLHEECPSCTSRGDDLTFFRTYHLDPHPVVGGRSRRQMIWECIVCKPCGTMFMGKNSKTRKT